MSDNIEVDFAKCAANAAHPINYKNDPAYKLEVDDDANARKFEQCQKLLEKGFPLLCRATQLAGATAKPTVEFGPGEIHINFADMLGLRVHYEGRSVAIGILDEAANKRLGKWAIGFWLCNTWADLRRGEGIPSWIEDWKATSNLDADATAYFLKRAYQLQLMPVPKTVFVNGQASLAEPINGGPK